MILVSACLAGVECRYNGTAFPCPGIVALVSSGKAIAVCPEVLGGLEVPRLPAEIVEFRVRTIRGEDVTDAYQAGAAAAQRRKTGFVRGDGGNQQGCHNFLRQVSL